MRRSYWGLTPVVGMEVIRVRTPGTPVNVDVPEQVIRYALIPLYPW